MRIRAFILVGAMASLTTNCTSKQEAASAPQLLLQAHFAGANQVSGMAEGSKLKAIAALPESQALLNHVLDRLSRSPSVLSHGGLSSNAVSSVAPLLRGMLRDLWQNEFSLTLQRVGDQPLDYALAVRLRPDQLLTWRTNLMTLAGQWHLGGIRQGTAGGLPTMEVGDTNAPIRLRWVETAQWGLLGIGSPSLPGLAAHLQTVSQNQPPVAPLGEAWLSLTADLQALAPLLQVDPTSPWPQIDVTVKGNGENLRSFGQIRFPKDVTGPLESWQVPTNIISEPLMSFGAARGFAPLLAGSPLLKRLGFDPVPNRCFTWSQQSQLGQTFAAFPMPGLSDLLPELAKTTSELIPASLRTNNPPIIHYSATNRSVSLQGLLPTVVPVLQSVQTPYGEFALASLFPPTPMAPPPQALLDQLQGTNLVFYNWEITEPRITQTLNLVQVASVMTRTPQLSPRQPSLRWLRAAAAHLGNSATEVLAESPRVWSFNRKSQIGLTAPELILLVRWIESVDFPRLGLRLPAEPAGATPPRPRSKTPPVPAPAQR